MTEIPLDQRLNEARALRTRGQIALRVIGGIALVLIGIVIGSGLVDSDALASFSSDLRGYWTNLYTEAISIMITVTILDAFARHREEQQLKRRLIREAAGQSNEIAKSAVDWMRHEGWLTGEDGLLKGADLTGANLAGANLEQANLRSTVIQEANLQGVKFESANFQEADLVGSDLKNAQLNFANLEGAYLRRADLGGTLLIRASLRGAEMISANLRLSTLMSANLERADLWLANLRGAYLRYANLDSAYLRGANLQKSTLSNANIQGANLREASLEGADLEDALFDQKTVLPDASEIGRDKNGSPIYDKYWTPDTDMTRYTNPDHPDFWQPDWVTDQK